MEKIAVIGFNHVGKGIVAQALAAQIHSAGIVDKPIKPVHPTQRVHFWGGEGDGPSTKVKTIPAPEGRITRRERRANERKKKR